MNLADLRELLPLYADGELDAARRARLEAALADSPDLRAELLRWRALRECARRSLAQVAVPDQLESLLREHLAASKPVFRTQKLLRVGGLVGIAAAVWLALLWLPGLLPLSGASRARAIDLTAAERVSPDAFADAYRKCSIRGHHTVGVTVSLPECDVQAKLQEARAFSVAVPDLTAYGFRLEGVCECLDAQRLPKIRTVHAHYRTGAERPELLSIFSLSTHVVLTAGEPASDPARAQQSMQVGRSGDVSVVVWDDRHNSFVACSRMDAAQLEAIVAHLDVAHLDAGPAALPLLLAEAP